MNDLTASPRTPRRLGGADIATILTGLALAFIGARFLAVPEAAAAAFGVPLAGIAAYAVTKGARDLSVGALLIALTLLGERRAAALTLVIGSVIPVIDGAVVLAWRGPNPSYLAMHWGTALFCMALGLRGLRRRAVRDLGSQRSSFDRALGST